MLIERNIRALGTLCKLRLLSGYITYHNVSFCVRENIMRRNLFDVAIIRTRSTDVSLGIIENAGNLIEAHAESR